MLTLTERSSARPNTVLVADDHALVRAGMKMLVADILGEVQFSEADDCDSLFHAARSNPTAHLALVDLKMPGMQGGFRLLEFSRRHPAIPLVIVSALSSPDVIRRLMNIRSVYAFIPKSAGTSIMRVALEAALRRQKVTAAEIARTEVPPPSIVLTQRQEEILRLLRQGMTNKMIASALGISPGTVKNHIHDLFKLLNATNRMQAAHASFEVE